MTMFSDKLLKLFEDVGTRGRQQTPSFISLLKLASSPISRAHVPNFSNSEIGQ